MSQPSQHSYIKMLGLHPSIACDMDITIDYSLSENDDRTDTVAAHYSKCKQKSVQRNQAFSQAGPSADLLPVPLAAKVTCHVSVTIPKTLQPIKVCEERLKSTTVGRPSKDAAVLSNCCTVPTVPQPMPGPVHPSVAVPVTAVSSVEPSLAYVPQQFRPQMSKPTPADKTPKVHKDWKKKSTLSPCALKYSSKSRFSNGGETTSKSEKSLTRLGSSNCKKRCKKHKCQKHGHMHSPKYNCKKASSHTEPLEKKKN
ncbi:hypothetical protein HPB51_020582 [Rhipicephalus microplus]|uniref:Uncharacterized protein n=1 Tax=Rhipicephalus microplus TaxID=6941 RepID=A0A9J6DXJ3_RHIMP|nr:hypothetical protein HPB51_020582 [Rhipicephalus microplus]